MDDNSLLKEFFRNFSGLIDFAQDSPVVNHYLRNSKMPEDYDCPLLLSEEELRKCASEFRKIVSIIYIINEISDTDYRQLEPYARMKLPPPPPLFHRRDGKELLELNGATGKGFLYMDYIGNE